MSRPSGVRHTVIMSVGGSGGVPARVAILGAYTSEPAAQEQAAAWRRRVERHGDAHVEITVHHLFPATGRTFAALYKHITGTELRR